MSIDRENYYNIFCPQENYCDKKSDTETEENSEDIDALIFPDEPRYISER